LEYVQGTMDALQPIGWSVFKVPWTHSSL